jgi:hypothetical protein
MTAQPIWITPAGSLGTVPEGTYYQVPLQVVDTVTIAINSIIGNGNTVTITFYVQPTATFQPGDSIIVSGVNPSNFNGTFIVTKCSTTQVTYTSSATGTWEGGGTITTIPSDVYFTAVAGALPSGIECTASGVIQGVPDNVVTVADEALVAGVNVTSKFAIRAYTKKTVGSVTVINRLADRTFTLTVAGQNLPSWVTPPGQIEQLFVGELLQPGIQLEYINDNPSEVLPAISLYSGQLPQGLTVSDTGLISGFVELNPTISATPGFSVAGQGFSSYPFDFSVDTENANYEFTLRVTDGRTSSLRTFSLYVWSTQTFNASTTLITADNTYLTASISTANVPVITNAQGSIGTAINNTFYAYQFLAKNITGDTIGFAGTSIPPGLTLDSTTGWLTGYLPTVGLTEVTYNFSVTAFITNTPSVTSSTYNYSLNVTGPLTTDITWLTPSNLGSISNGSVSMFYVAAANTLGLSLQYRLLSGSNSRLPQGLTLLSNGLIVGRVSFNIFSVDNGTTTFDRGTTTFDLNYTFTVNAYSINGYISVNKTYTLKVLNAYDKPYENLYIECMPPSNDRQIITNFLQNVNIFTPSLLYRADDPNFGLSNNVMYYHAYGLNAENIDTYVTALQLNHYWKDLLLGSIKTAQAIDPITGNVIYEVVYSEIIDTLVNNSEESVSKEVVLPYSIQNQTIDVVYPNSLDNMRNQVIDVVGQESPMLPLWMLSKQTNGNILGFTPAWVIAYTIPGASGQVKYNIETQFGIQLNQVDFTADRYEIDSALTVNWDGTTQSWIPSPPESATFDINHHYDVTIASDGIGYARGDQIKILGTSLGGVTPNNDLLITVNTVDETGNILDIFYYGTASILAADNSYDNLAGVNVIGTGSGANWDIIVVPGRGTIITPTITVGWYNSSNTILGWVNVDSQTVNWISDTLGSPRIFDTLFDGGSTTFTEPADSNTTTNSYDKYLLYPKRNILI